MICTLLTYFLLLIAAVPSSKFLNSENKSFKVHCRANFLFFFSFNACRIFVKKLEGSNDGYKFSFYPKKKKPRFLSFSCCSAVGAPIERFFIRLSLSFTLMCKVGGGGYF